MLYCIIKQYTEDETILNKLDDLLYVTFPLFNKDDPSFTEPLREILFKTYFSSSKPEEVAMKEALQFFKAENGFDFVPYFENKIAKSR